MNDELAKLRADLADATLKAECWRILASRGDTDFNPLEHRIAADARDAERCRELAKRHDDFVAKLQSDVVLWKERAEFAVKELGERLATGVEQFLASRRMHHIEIDRRVTAEAELKELRSAMDAILDATDRETVRLAARAARATLKKLDANAETRRAKQQVEAEALLASLTSFIPTAHAGSPTVTSVTGFDANGSEAP